MIARHVTGYHMTSTMTRVAIVTSHATLLGCVIPLILALDPNPRPLHLNAVQPNRIHMDKNSLDTQPVSMATDSARIPLGTGGDTRHAGTQAGWSSCPPACLCHPDTRSVRCHGSPLSDDSPDHRSVPRGLPGDSVSLNMSRCDGRSLSDTSAHAPDGALDYFMNETTLGNDTSVADSPAPSFSLDALSDVSNLQMLDLSCNDIHVFNMRRLPSSLTHLYLHHNHLARLDLTSLIDTLPQLVHLDISDNQLVHLDISGNQLEEVNAEETGALNVSLVESGADNGTSSLAELLLTGNRLDHLPAHLCAHPLTALRLDDNALQSLSPHSFAQCSQLELLSLAGNPITDLPSNSFTGLSTLRHLNLSRLAIEVIHAGTFAGLDDLRTLDLSHNTQLHVIHAHAFSRLTSLHVLDLRNDNLDTLHEGTLDGLQGSIHLSGNPWRCDCNIHWLLSPGNASYSHDDPRCTQPPHLHNSTFSQVPQNDTCEGAFIVNITRFPFFKVGSEAVLDCVAYGDPAPVITWTTSRKQVFRYDPATADHERLDPADPRYHSDHTWHGSGAYLHAGDYERVHLLANGSLYIDSVSRADGGVYHCAVANAHARDEARVRVYLDYTGLYRTVWRTMLVGLFAAVGFLLFGLLVGTIRNAVSWFRIRHKEDTNRRMRGMLHSLSDYKAAQMDRLTAYKAEKIGQLSAFKASKMDKLQALSRPSLQPAVHHMTSMREHYTAQIDVIKDNCSAKAERLRENYVERVQRFRDFRSYKVGKFRGYKAEKVERMRENYTAQVHRLREYGSAQMARLRSSYKLQQHYALKLYELLDIANCMTVLEAECMRTESMLFDDSFMSTLGHNPALTDSDDDDDGSYYVTASSQSDVSMGNDVIHESVSDDLEPEEMNFTDIQIEPFPPYLNFLEAITLETQKHHKTGDVKPKKHKRKSKKEKKKKTQETTNIPQKQPSKKSKCKSAHRKSQAQARRAQGSDDSETDNEQQNLARFTTESETTPRKHARSRSKPTCFKARTSSDEIQLSVHRPLTHPGDRSLLQTVTDGAHAPSAPHVFLSPSLTLSLRSHADEETQSSLYESAHASREASPQLRERASTHYSTGAESLQSDQFQTNYISDSMYDAISNQNEVPSSRDEQPSGERDVGDLCDTETSSAILESITNVKQHLSGLRDIPTDSCSLTGEVSAATTPSGAQPLYHADHAADTAHARAAAGSDNGQAEATHGVLELTDTQYYMQEGASEGHSSV